MNEKWNVFDVIITEKEKEELSQLLFHFHDDYENEFYDYFSEGKENEEVEDFMYWYRRLYDLIDDLMYRETKSEKVTDSVT